MTENQRLNFPKSPGPLVDILTNKCKTKQFVSKIISFSGVRGGQAMGVGNFPAWDMFEVDVGKVPPVLVEQLDNIDTFSVNMSNIIEWVDFKGMHGIGTGNLKAVKVDWQRLERTENDLEEDLSSNPVGRLPQVELTCCTINNNVLWLVSASRFFESGTLTFKFKREKSAACLN